MSTSYENYAQDPFFQSLMDPAFGIENVFPRHVPSRLVHTVRGDLLWRPAADIWDSEDGTVVVHLDLPGVKREEIAIDAGPEQITIHGNHAAPEGLRLHSRAKRWKICKISKDRETSHRNGLTRFKLITKTECSSSVYLEQNMGRRRGLRSSIVRLPQ
ncbi:hypothetical protein BJ742DRAFT_777658 [Cladochytrium replicatum]|nr:hypothetical protein BJ742DRAFT_777658 [Cladochytrium replicatum]